MEEATATECSVDVSHQRLAAPYVLSMLQLILQGSKQRCERSLCRGGMLSHLTLCVHTRADMAGQPEHCFPLSPHRPSESFSTQHSSSPLLTGVDMRDEAYLLSLADSRTRVRKRGVRTGSSDSRAQVCPPAQPRIKELLPFHFCMHFLFFS